MVEVIYLTWKLMKMCQWQLKSFQIKANMMVASLIRISADLEQQSLKVSVTGTVNLITVS